MNIIERIFTDGSFDDLNNISRWNGLNRIKEETVAQHSYMVSLFSRLLIEEMAENIDKDLSTRVKLFVTTYAIFHDFDEIITGDIKHTLKYDNSHGKELRDLLDKIVSSQVSLRFDDKTSSGNLILGNVLNDFSDFEYSLKKVVKLADWLSMLFFICKEKSLGNINLDFQFHYCIEKTNEICLNILADDYIKKFNTNIIFQILNTKTWLNKEN